MPTIPVRNEFVRAYLRDRATRVVLGHLLHAWGHPDAAAIIAATWRRSPFAEDMLLQGALDRAYPPRPRVAGHA